MGLLAINIVTKATFWGLSNKQLPKKPWTLLLELITQYCCEQTDPNTIIKIIFFPTPKINKTRSVLCFFMIYKAILYKWQGYHPSNLGFSFSSVWPLFQFSWLVKTNTCPCLLSVTSHSPSWTSTTQPPKLISVKFLSGQELAESIPVGRCFRTSYISCCQPKIGRRYHRGQNSGGVYRF